MKEFDVKQIYDGLGWEFSGIEAEDIIRNITKKNVDIESVIKHIRINTKSKPTTAKIIKLMIASFVKTKTKGDDKKGCDKCGRFTPGYIMLFDYTRDEGKEYQYIWELPVLSGHCPICSTHKDKDYIWSKKLQYLANCSDRIKELFLLCIFYGVRQVEKVGLDFNFLEYFELGFVDGVLTDLSEIKEFEHLMKKSDVKPKSIREISYDDFMLRRKLWESLKN